MNLTLDNWCTLPTPMGEFRMYDTGNKSAMLISFGDLPTAEQTPLLRIHSSCAASEVFGALDCDCADQLRESMKLIADERAGLIVYLDQEGRGHGLTAKILAVSLMEREHLDTADSFKRLGLEQDVRNYSQVVAILKQTGIRSVRLITNNPRKAKYLDSHDINTSIVSTHPNVRPENIDYLHSKNTKLGHTLPLGNDHIDGEVIYFYHSDQPWGELSNFSQHAIFLDGKIWPTVEHFYQANKFTGLNHQEGIRCCPTATLAKQNAHKLSSRHGRSDWINIREAVMVKALRAKFSQHPDLARKLISSGTRPLVELTRIDDFWGDPGDGSGQNRLGILLMQVRAEVSTRASAQPSLS